VLERLLTTLKNAAPIRDWAMFLSAPPLTALAAGLVWIVWKGGWAPARAEQQLWYLGVALLGTIFLIGVIVVALASVKVKGFGVEVDGDD
jgi:hypothetical protein